jgi:hypothetical protein
MRKPKKWKVTNNRFVAFIDILGFRDLVMREDHAAILSLLYSIQEENGFIFENNSFFSDDIYVVTFSDSIILFTKGDTFHDFRQLFTVVGNLMSRMVFLSVPAKGAVAHGSISVDKGKNIFFGQPIIDSYLLGEDLSYIGVVAHNSLDKYVASLEPNLKSLLQQYLVEISTPFKYGTINHLNVNWPLYSFLLYSHKKSQKEINEAHQEWIMQLLFNLKIKCSGSPRRYIENTINLIDKFNNQITEV